MIYKRIGFYSFINEDLKINFEIMGISLKIELNFFAALH